MDNILMNSRNSKTYNYHRLLLNLTNKINFKCVASPNFRIYYTWKNIKESYFQDLLYIISIKYQIHHGMKNFN